MYYYVWGAVVKDSSCTACNTKDELEDRVKERSEGLPRDTAGARASGSAAGWRSWWML